MDAQTKYEAIKLNSFEIGGETKWSRTFLANLKANDSDDGFRLYLPEGIAVSGEIIIQPKQQRQEQEQAAA